MIKMAAGVAGVLTALLIICIFIQLRSVLFFQNLDDKSSFQRRTVWPVHTTKILCYGKDIIHNLISNSEINEKNSQNKRTMKTLPLIGFLCLLLSGDINLNPGPICLGCKEDSPLPKGITYFTDMEWICDHCVNYFSKNYELDQSTDQLLDQLPKGISVGHLNARGLMSKLDQLRIVLRNQTFDVIGISETRLDDSIDDAEIHIKGYHNKVYRRDRNKHGGGVLLYIKDKWTVTNVSKHEFLEVLTLDIKQLNSPTLKLGVVYRPPDSLVQWYTDFDSVAEELATSAENIIVMGDFNVDQLKDDRMTKVMNTYNYKQLIAEPTRVTKDTSTLIDHMYVTNDENFSTAGVIPFGISDHHFTYVIRKKVKCGPRKHTTIQYRDYKHLDEALLIQDMCNVDWNTIRNMSDINEMWSTFKDQFNNIIDKHIPYKERRINVNSEKWINDDIITAMRQRDYLHSKALKSNSELDWSLFKRSRNIVVSKVREAKRTFVDEAIEQSSMKPKDMWDRLKQFIPSKSKSVSTSYLDVNGKLISQSDEMANAFNDFFCNIGHNLGKDFDCSLPSVEMLMEPNSFSIPKMTESFVKKEIFKMSSAKATGLDNISVKLLKMTSSVITNILTYIMNFSIENCIVENDWKVARVTPIFKSGDEHTVNNFRPVSVLPIVSKILERHVFNSFYEYLSVNNLITNCQSGFRPKHSCETVLTSLIDRWLKNIDQGKLTGVLFIDLSKAFDTVNHTVLLHKLKMFGVSDNTLEWFESYLCSRKQLVSWNGVLSEPRDITIGVPQGSILGPLFFILFVNDYPKCLRHSHATIYADDTSQDVSDKCIDVIERKLKDDLINSINWMKCNKLTMNLKKTQCMLIGTSQRLANCRKMCINIDNIVLETVDSSKLLGVNIDCYLSWSDHIDILSKKISKKIGVLKRLKSFMSYQALLKVYNSIIFPHFNYCCTIWSNAKCTNNVDKIFRLQKRAARVILNVQNVMTPSDVMFSKLRWMPIPDYFLYRKAILVFKVLHQLTPEYLNVFKFVNQVSTRSTRQSVNNLLYVPKARTEYYRRSFIISGSVLWNNMSQTLRNCTTLDSFKKAYLDNYFSNTA